MSQIRVLVEIQSYANEEPRKHYVHPDGSIHPFYRVLLLTFFRNEATLRLETSPPVQRVGKIAALSVNGTVDVV